MNLPRKSIAINLILLSGLLFGQCGKEAQDAYQMEVTSPTSRAVKIGKFRALFEISTMATHHKMMERMGIKEMEHNADATHVLSATLIDNEQGKTMMPAGARFSFKSPEMKEFSEPVPAHRMMGGGMGHLTLDINCKTAGSYSFYLHTDLENNAHRIPVHFENLKCNQAAHSHH